MEILTFLKKIFWDYDLGGDKIVKFFRLKNIHFIMFVPLFACSWALYYNYFISWFNYTWRFVPTYFLGFISCYILLDYFKEKQNNKLKQ